VNSKEARDHGIEVGKLNMLGVSASGVRVRVWKLNI
jgi:hypothetical protein